MCEKMCMCARNTPLSVRTRRERYEDLHMPRPPPALDASALREECVVILR